MTDFIALRRKYAAIPEWRRPLGAAWGVDPEESLRVNLREALYDLASDKPQTLEDLAAGVREHWGEATDKQIQAQLRELVRADAIVRVAGGYVRKEEP
ncbi:MAG TPA: hypothetical protein VFT22_07135 [Kofleriaceae bacterium]|nr:hypothetical protein [Kofleriaceae bacterium]